MQLLWLFQRFSGGSYPSLNFGVSRDRHGHGKPLHHASHVVRRARAPGHLGESFQCLPVEWRRPSQQGSTQPCSAQRSPLSVPVAA
jgi:hypothetical protein